MSLRLLRAEDVPALAALWVASWQETLPQIDFSARRPWIEEFLSAPDGCGRMTYVGEGCNGPLGFVTFEPASGHLHQLVVAIATKGQGAAVRLLDHAKLIAPRGLTLDVNQDNPRAVRFYEREGFVRKTAGVNPSSGLATWRMRWTPAG